jgi:glycosyltransferase involved in cell wall biosynthesis
MLRLTRLGVWGLRVAWAAAGGWAIRRVRRLLKRPPRIWRGMNGLHLIKWPVVADRHAGFRSRSFISSTGMAYSLFRDEDFDVVCDKCGWGKDDWHWRGLIDLLMRADIRVAFFDSLFFSPHAWKANAWVLRLIRLVGIKTIMTPHGMDIFYRDGRVTRYDWVARAQQDYWAWDLREHRSLAARRTRLWCRYADLVVDADPTCSRFLPRRDVSFKWFPVDCDALRPSDLADVSSHGRPVVIHAPQHRMIKGTDYLLAAADRLKARGISMELRLIEKTSRHEALRLYAEAEIIADQFCMGAYGMFALEGLALGKTVLTYLDQEHLGDPVFNLPIVNANPDNLEQVLAALLAVPELRARIGRAGREAAKRYQSIEALAEVWAQLYRHVWWGEPLRLEETRHFSPERKPRSFTEDPAHGDFWPVPVDDLMPQIHAALERLAAPARSELAVLS